MNIKNANRPDLLVLICGTNTEIGKTWISAQTLRILREAGTSVAARKLAQSFAPGESRTDAQVLGEASDEPTEVVCPPHRWYETPMAPPMAAEALGKESFTIEELIDEVNWPRDVEIGLIETAGGVRSPQASDGDVIDIARTLQPDLVVLVGDSELGTINTVRLSLDALGDWPCVVVLNRFDNSVELHRRNRDWLAKLEGYEILCSARELAQFLKLGNIPGRPLLS